jgi:hypothetical protein
MYDTEEQAWTTIMETAECIRSIASIHRERALRLGTALGESPDRDAITEILKRLKDIWEILATTKTQVMLDQFGADKLI